jgi:dienelactone hydrolase
VGTIPSHFSGRVRLALAASLILASCGGGSSQAPTSPASASSATSAPTAAPSFAALSAGGLLWNTKDLTHNVVPGVTWWLEGSSPDGHAVDAAIFRPSGAGPFPAVVYLHRDTGVTADQLALGRVLSEGGFIVVVGCYTRASSVLTCRQPPDDPVGAMIELAKLLPGARNGTIGLVGCSIGGSQALVTAAQRNDIGAIVADSQSGAPAELPTAPTLLLASDQDPSVVEAVHKYETSLRQNGTSVEAKYYENGGHIVLFSIDTLADARSRAIAFLSKNLKP